MELANQEGMILIIIVLQSDSLYIQFIITMTRIIQCDFSKKRQLVIELSIQKKLLLT